MRPCAYDQARCAPVNEMNTVDAKQTAVAQRSISQLRSTAGRGYRVGNTCQANCSTSGLRLSSDADT